MSQLRSSAAGRSRKYLLPGLAGMLLLSSGCMVGPKYQRPSAPVSPAYKEPPPDGWKEGRPNDGAIRGKWWEIYEDPDLNSLEEQVSISNQNVLAAESENARLFFQAELAQDYFQLHGADAGQDLLERTVNSYEEYLQLTRNRFKSGVASGADVAQAETQLETARSQLIDLGVARAQLEHAI